MRERALKKQWIGRGVMCHQCGMNSCKFEFRFERGTDGKLYGWFVSVCYSCDDYSGTFLRSVDGKDPSLNYDVR